MNRQDLVEDLTRKGYTNSEAKFLVDRIISKITRSIVKGDVVRLNGFGTFQKGIRRGREYTLNGKKASYPDRMTVKYTPSETLKGVL